MKTIIVPTDFSRNAAHAEAYAVQLAHKLGHRVLLVHAFEAPVAISEYEISTIHFHAMEERIARQLEEKKEELQREYGTDVPIETLVCNEDLIGHLSDLYKERDTFLAVIGLTGAGMVNFFLGSNTLNIVNNLGRAVLTIPPFTPFKPIKSIVFAFDLWNVSEMLPVKRIKRIRDHLDASLTILNLTPESPEENHEWLREKKQLEEALAGVPYTFHALSGKRVVSRINEFVKKQQADLLAIVPREKGFIENLLGENHTKALLFRSGLPILTLPPDDD